MTMLTKFFILFGLIIICAGVATYFVIQKPMPALEQHTVQDSSRTPEASDTMKDWQTYKDKKFSFTLQYPVDVSMLSSEQSGHFFNLTIEHPVIFKLGDTELFSVGAGNRATKNLQGQYIMPIAAEYYEENCTAPFFGNAAIPAARFGFGDGGASDIFYSIVFANGDSIALKMYETDYRGLEGYEQKQTREDQRKALAESILKTLKFSNANQPIKFTCPQVI